MIAALTWLLLLCAHPQAHEGHVHGSGRFHSHPVTSRFQCEQALESGEVVAAEQAEKAQPNPLEEVWNKAQLKLPALEKIGKENSYFAQIARAASAALGKHHQEFTREPHWKQLDVARHLAILREIAAFDPAQPKFSAYKIKRSIEGRHSLKEYIECLSEP